MSTLTRAVALFLGILILCSSSFLCADPLKMAHGWSVHPKDGEVAVNGAIAMMQKKVKNPRFIVLYTTADYGEREIAKTLQSRFPGAKLLGMNVYKGVFSSDGLHIGERGSLAIMRFAGGDLVYGVSAREVPEGTDVISLTKEAFADAARDAGKSPEDCIFTVPEQPKHWV